MTGREECLKAAMSIVTGSREMKYGRPENNLENIAKLWNVFLGMKGVRTVKLEAFDVAYMMTLMKIARAVNHSSVADSIIDACGYLACAYEIAFGGDEGDTNA